MIQRQSLWMCTCMFPFTGDVDGPKSHIGCNTYHSLTISLTIC